MRTTRTIAGLFVSATLLFAACTGGASPSPSAASPSAAATAAASSAAPSASASAEATASAEASPSAEASASGTAGTGADLKIGVVTDIGTINDKNYNEYSYKGAQAGASAIGADEPPYIVPTSDAEYPQAIQSFVDQDFDVIVTVGFNLADETIQAAHDNPDIWFLGVDQSPICVTPEGLPDADFACEGDAKTLLPKLISVYFAEDQAGYLAGIVAAGVSESNVIGAIGGTSICAPCVRYIQGYELGAQSVKPDVQVVTAYVTNDFSAAAFSDQAGGKTFAENFLAQNANVDVLFQVAGLTGNGVLDAACAADIYGIGVDVDQAVSYPNAAPCLVTSAEKNLELAVSSTLEAIADGSAEPGDVLFDASNDGIAASEGHDNADNWAPDTQQLLDEALEAMKAGTLETCPENCGQAG